MRQFLKGIPIELDETAELDGATSWNIFWQILMPLSKPAIATMATLGFIFHWNSFLAPLIYLNTPEKFTAPIGLRLLLNAVSQPHTLLPRDSLLMAGAVVVAIPGILLFIVAQRYFVQGIVTTGLKG
jgi:multiple sugar transport system permease protein